MGCDVGIDGVTIGPNHGSTVLNLEAVVTIPAGMIADKPPSDVVSGDNNPWVKNLAAFLCRGVATQPVVLVSLVPISADEMRQRKMLLDFVGVHLETFVIVPGRERNVLVLGEVHCIYTW